MYEYVLYEYLNINYSLFTAGYMLEVDPAKRPDIFQVASVAFRLAGRECPIQNLHV